MARLVSAIGRSAEYLTDTAIDVLIDEHPSSYGALVQARDLADAQKCKLLGKKLDASHATSLYWGASTDVLTYAVMVTNERRQGPLSAILSLARPAHDIQYKLSGRKLHETVLTELVSQGLTAEAALRVMGKQELTGFGTANILELHAEVLEADVVADCLGKMTDVPMFGAYVASLRHDVRRAVLTGNHRSAVIRLAATYMDDEEQALALELADNGKLPVHAVAMMLDRPTTRMSVRTRLWDEFGSTVTRQGWMVPEPDLLPEVDCMADLDARTVSMLLLRGAHGEWGPGRAMQLIELLESSDHHHRAATVWRHVHQNMTREIRIKAGLAWIESSGEMPNELRTAIDTCQRKVETRRERVKAALEHTGMVGSSNAHTPVVTRTVSTISSDGSAVPKDVSYWSSDSLSELASYLSEHLGENRAAWSMAFSLLDTYPGPVSELTKMVTAATTS